MSLHRAPSRRVGRLVLALLPLALLWPALRHGVESRMALHMLGEFPVLFISGWSSGTLCFGHLPARRWLRAQRLFDWHGGSGAVLCNAVALVWMVPSALDAALLWPAAAAVKVASWWLAGWLLADGWRRMDSEVLLFFVGNLAWMAATAGLLYIEAPVRLCANYLQGDQRHAGFGLVMLALLLGALALRRVLSNSSAPDNSSASGTAPAALPHPKDAAAIGS
ncbi:MAG: hypothetical protein JNL87_13445 [Burkholderiaceae bacterium]|nr:hypothetical protein [Burkholderiaceae bacterium]